MPEAHFIDPHELHVITSICVAVYPEDGLDAATLISCDRLAAATTLEQKFDRRSF